MYYVYIIFSAKINKYYVGSTENLELRIIKHNLGTTRYTSQTNDWKIVYCENYQSKTEALKRENEIKRKKSRKYIEDLLKS